ncbi:predicted protein [Naegleria gruberi]|uniref:Predicted protein n=1 Tax=Naegleria gruberi TaxID=5762 RepID=D2VE43_NAEGR|nr:uncharacterized protein NAEGRDRAFT_48803 [Naegleria gruberi]EFC44818.1 predicted protein [Naegleria gruberi]|eukprot:XP_002677562.1 predicted protein [Naegleria gruberi strain NEG-M]
MLPYRQQERYTIRSLVYIFTCILFVFLMLSFESGVVYSASTSMEYIQFLRDRRIARDYAAQRRALLQNYTDTVQKQQQLARAQYRAISTASIALNSNVSTNSNSTYQTPLTFVSQAGITRAMTRNLQQLQTLTVTKSDNVIVNVAMDFYLNGKYKSAVSLLNGLEKTMNSTINPIPFTTPLVSGKLTYFNANSTSIYFRSPKVEPPRERMFMCTGDAFGIHLDPATRVLYSWGTTTLGRIPATPAPGRVDLPLDSDEYIKQVACGQQHGTNANGEVGAGYQGVVTYPVKIKSHSNTITFINAGPYNSVYLDSDGYAFSWGRGSECQLGTGSTAVSSSPVKISNTLKFTKICFGKSHAVGRTTSGVMYYWCTPTNFTSDFFVYFSSSIIDFQCGDSSTLALLDTGRVFGWGYNYNGQLGTDVSSSTINPSAISTTNIGSRKIVKLFHKNEQAFALADDQTIWAWGRNDDNVCNLGLARFNYWYDYSWSSYGRKGCGTQYAPDSLLSPPGFDYVHEIHIMKESAILAYNKDREMGFYAGGKFSVPFFSSGYSGFRNYYTKAFIFSIAYIVPYEKVFPVFDLSSLRIVYSENNFISLSNDNMDMIMVGKSDMSVNIAKTTYEMFAAFSFCNTHDFTKDGAVFYFGGVVNNVVSNRIALKTSVDSIQIFNQTLPYPVASGMLAIVDEYLYIFGGLTDDRGTTIPTYKVMRCHLNDLLIWEEVSKVLPRAIYNGVAQVIGDNIYLFGGRVGRLALNSDILYASASEMIWQNSYRVLPHPYTESNLFSDDTYLYMTGGFSPTYSELKGISRALKSNPLVWEDINQKLPMPTMGITSTLILNNKLNLFSVDLPQNFLKTNPNVPISIHSIYFANETKPYVPTTTGVVIALQTLDSAYFIGNVLRSCREYKDLIPSAASGVYWVKPLDTMNKFKVYCDMEYLGGGWALVSSRTTTNNIAIPLATNDYVKVDVYGYSVSDDKWGALRNVSSDILWRDPTGYYGLASISTLSTGGSFVCKTLASSLLDTELYRVEDGSPCNYGTDTCSLGGPTTKSGAITSYCGSIKKMFKKLMLKDDTKRFDARKFVVTYDEVMENSEARDLFLHYLKTVASNEEPLLFVNDVEVYRNEYSKLPSESNQKNQVENLMKSCEKAFERAHQIMNTYIRNGSDMELNLSSSKREVLSIWDEKIEPYFSVGSQSYSSTTGIIQLKRRSSVTVQFNANSLGEAEFLIGQIEQVFETLNPDNLFRNILLSIEIDLKCDQFPRFSRSELLFSFLKKQGENFTRQIAIDTSKGYNVDFRFKPSHLNSNEITEKDIYFGYSLMEDSPDWEMIKNSKNSNSIQFFYSKTQYVFQDDTAMHLTKFNMTVPYPLEDVWKVFLHVTAIEEGKDNMIDIRTIHYKEATKDSLGMNYSVGVLDLNLPGFKNRDITQVHTSIHDELANSYVIIGHSGNFAEFGHEPKDMGRYDGFFFYRFDKINDNSTRFINVLYSDIHLPKFLIHKSTLVKLFKKRAYFFQDKLESILKERMGNSNFDESSLLDKFQVQRALEDNKIWHSGKSYYLEFQKRRKSE